ncbi:MAG: hypothetical protein L0I17_11055 [Actinomycetia bacterium]|nr:hypothetical protein [Actinomycetes bacterium]
MTITRAEARDTITTALRGIDGLTVYPGTIPDRVPTYSTGVIRPYVGVWVTNSTDDPWSRSLSTLTDADTIRIRIQTQVVAATDAMVYDVADRVSAVLTNLPVGVHWVTPDTDQQAGAYILTDTGTTPARPYLPLSWQLTTQ